MSNSRRPWSFLHRWLAAACALIWLAASLVSRNKIQASAGPTQISPQKAHPTLVTRLMPGSSVIAGTAVYDTVTLVGATADAGGAVSYMYFCTLCFDPVFVATVPVTNGVVLNSPAVIFAGPGSYQWVASYTGDDKNDGAQSLRSDEPLEVLRPPYQRYLPAVTS